MTLGQLDDYNFLRTRLSRRYDPPEREEAHRAELRVRTRRRNESADEFAENIKNLAQRAYPLADQNMLDNLVVERFREGHGNEELNKRPPGLIAPLLKFCNLLGNPSINTTKGKDLIFNEGIRLLNMADNI